jgi:hypothetical protein
LGLLGMYAAARNGVKFEPEVWQRNLQMARRRQCEDGGWAYRQSSSSYGSMTCAGICAVAINRYHLAGASTRPGGGTGSRASRAPRSPRGAEALGAAGGAAKAKFCTSCGAQVKPGAKFCGGCGATVK